MKSYYTKTSSHACFPNLAEWLFVTDLGQLQELVCQLLQLHRHRAPVSAEHLLNLNTTKQKLRKDVNEMKSSQHSQQVTTLLN